MKKVVAFIILCFTCFTLVACGGTNYPGNTKAKYWLSNDNTMMFYFPAEAGRGNAAGHYLTAEETVEDIILKWNAKTGVVEVMTAGYEKMFTANTVTDSENLICTFAITSQEESYSFPDEMIFHWEQTVNFGCINNIHAWSDELWYIPGGLDAYYHCTVCGEKQLVEDEPGNNDILYAAAYPEDFEFNGKHYHIVQGDGLKKTATQEELGELLGYIIREEDVPAFTGEYRGVDYVIDNGIYDYETNNRVALYSLKSYPDLSIICMRQLGDYVLFQSEGEQDLQFEIRDREKEENLPCDTALEKFYEDENGEYYFSVIKSQYVIVIYNDGTSEDIVTALNAGRVSIADLDEFGIEYHIEPKQ